MSKVNAYYGKCGTCDKYAICSKPNLGATGSLAKIKGAGFRCSKYGQFFELSETCSHFSWNKKVTDSDLTSAEKMIMAYKSSLNTSCFITTAILEVLNDPYGHLILDKLKYFRNEVLQKNPSWHPILHHYDTVGPKIAKALHNDPNKHNISDQLCRRYLVKCSTLVDMGNELKLYTDCEDIRNMNYLSAIDVYVEMTNWLAAHYNIENSYDMNIRFTPENVYLMGHGDPIKEISNQEELIRSRRINESHN